MDCADLLWRWANDPVTRRNAFSKAPIPYADHLVWLGRRLASDATRVWIFCDGRTPVGQVRIDRVGDAAEIDISVASEHRGRGYGRDMLTQSVRRMREEWGPATRPRALVLDTNAVSLALFQACGFRAVGRVDRGPGRGAVGLAGG